MIWLVGLLAFLVYRVFNAGMNSKSLFYSEQKDYDYVTGKKQLVNKFDSDKVVAYCVVTVGVCLTWPISLPCIGIYLLGKRYAK